jgi:hypothetical protein
VNDSTLVDEDLQEIVTGLPADTAETNGSSKTRLDVSNAQDISDELKLIKYSITNYRICAVDRFTIYLRFSITL